MPQAAQLQLPRLQVQELQDGEQPEREEEPRLKVVGVKVLAVLGADVGKRGKGALRGYFEGKLVLGSLAENQITSRRCRA